MTVLGARPCPCEAGSMRLEMAYVPYDNTYRIACKFCTRAAMSLADWNLAVDVENAGGIGFPGVGGGAVPIPADPIHTRRVGVDKVLRNTGATFVAEIPKGAHVCEFRGMLVIAHADHPLRVIRLADGVVQEVIFGPVVP